MYIFIWVIIVLCLATVYLLFKYTKKRGLSQARIQYYHNKINQLNNEDYYKQIIQYDSMLSNILKELWYSWWLWEQLKKKPIILDWKLNSIWELHKLRNKVAHELWDINEYILKSSAMKYRQILINILQYSQ